MGIKDIDPGKGIILLLLLLLIIALLLGRNSNTITHFMAGQVMGWQTVDFNQKETDNFIIRYTAIDHDNIDLIAGASEYAFREVTDFFAGEPRGKTRVVVYPDTISLARSFGWDKSQKAEGVYWAGSIRIISPQLWQEQPQAAAADTIQAGPLVHEFAHLMVDEQTRGNYNRWWTEGIAQYIEKRITGFQFDQPLDNAPIIYPLSGLDNEFDGEDSWQAYWQSLQIIEYIVDENGEASLFSIMDHLSRGENIRQGISQALSVDFDQWEQGLYQVLRNNAGQEV